MESILLKKLLLSLLILYSILGFIVVPLVLKSQLSTLVEDITTTSISVDSIYFNPFSFKLKLSDIKLRDARDAKLFTLKSLNLNVELYSLFKSAIHIKNLHLQRPDIFLVYEKDKTINLASLMKKEDKKKSTDKGSDTKLPRIIIDNISIDDGILNYEDYTHDTKFDLALNDIKFKLKDIDTADLNTSDATIRFYTTLGDGGFLDFKSKILGFEPFVLNGSIKFEASKLYSQYKYIQDMLNLEVADGKIDFDAKYYLNLDDLNATTIDEINIAVNDLRIKPKHKYKDILNLDSFKIINATVKPMQKIVQIDEVLLSSLDIKIARDTDAKIDWLDYIKVDTQEVAKEEQEKQEGQAEQKPWDVTLDKIDLKKIALNFRDAGVEPEVDTQLNEMNIYLKDLTLSGIKPLSYKLNLRVNEEFRCDIAGDARDKFLSVGSNIRCSGLDIVKFHPYIDEIARDALTTYDIRVQEAVLGFDANLTLSELDTQLQVDVKNSNIYLDRFVLRKTSSDEPLVSFSDFNVKEIKLNTKHKRLDIKSSTLSNLDIQAKLYANSKLNFENLIVVKEQKEAKKKKVSKEKSYSVHLNHFALKSAKVGFDDYSLKPNHKTEIDKIFIDAYNIDSKAKSCLDYNLALRINSKGYAKSKGKISHTPLKQKGLFSLENISLKEFTPYLQKTTYLKLDDGYVNLKSKISYEKSSRDADLSVSGSLFIDEFFLNDVRDNSSLLSFNKMALKDFKYKMFPNSAFINELDLDSFYINTVIDEDKKMNLLGIIKPQKVQKPKPKPKTTDTEPFDFKIMKLKLSSGSAYFADLSLPLKFQTDIHDLNGVIYSISSQKSEISYIDIDGEVDKYGSTKLIGSIDSSSPTAYTDLEFSFRNLDLSSLSGYSTEFAGYKIDDGKLFLDLGYNIVDSNLSGKNSVIIKKIKLGDRLDDENVTSLPLGFAIALLEDKDGIIDINVPVEGNTDAPDFKYGALILDTFTNLVIKAVASPFKFLASVMGIDSDKLEHIEFEAGLANILAPEREKLDHISKMMIKRPKISIYITPQYDLTLDGWILKKQKFINLVMQKSASKSIKKARDAMNIKIVEPIYKDLTGKNPRDIKKSLEIKYKDNLLERKYLNALIKESISKQILGDNELEALANKRVSLIKEYLVNQKGMDRSKIIFHSIKTTKSENTEWVEVKLDIGVTK